MEDHSVGPLWLGRETGHNVRKHKPSSHLSIFPAARNHLRLQETVWWWGDLGIRDTSFDFLILCYGSDTDFDLPDFDLMSKIKTMPPMKLEFK